jgi:hypothetical protein
MSNERWFNEGGTVYDENRLPVAHVVGQNEDDSDARLIASVPALYDAARLVIARWESGDLAQAVRELDAIIHDIDN